MKTLLRFAALLLLVALCRPAIAEEKDAPRGGRPLLWRIELKDCKPSYIFGTIHLPTPSVARIVPAVADAIQATDEVVTEIRFEPASLAGMGQRMMLPEGKTLADILPADLLTEVNAEYERILPGLGPKMAGRMKVIYAAATLGLLEEQMKHPGGVALDLLLSGRAGNLGKGTSGLETFEEQAAALESFTEAEQITSLRDALSVMKKYRDKGTSITAELIASYLSGDPEKVDETINATLRLGDKAVGEKFIRILLTERNHRMAERALARMRENPGKGFFFAIGAGHLHGAEGLLKLLEKAGCTLHRIEPAAVK